MTPFIDGVYVHGADCALCERLAAGETKMKNGRDISPYCPTCDAHGWEDHVCIGHFRCKHCGEKPALSEQQWAIHGMQRLAHGRVMRVATGVCKDCWEPYNARLRGEGIVRPEGYDPFEGIKGVDGPRHGR